MCLSDQQRSLSVKWIMSLVFKKDSKHDHSIWAISFYLISVTCINTVFIPCYTRLPRWARQFLGVQDLSKPEAKNILKELIKMLYLNLCLFEYNTALFYKLKKIIIRENKSFRERDTLYSATERQPSPKDGT